MTMQNNIDTIRGNFRWNMHQPEFQTLALEINDQRPVFVPIAITTDDSEGRSDRLEIESDRRFADVAQMPNLVGIARQIDNLRRQLVMRVRQNKNPNHLYLRKARKQETKALTNSGLPVFLRDNWPGSCEVSL